MIGFSNRIRPGPDVKRAIITLVFFDSTWQLSYKRSSLKFSIENLCCQKYKLKYSKRRNQYCRHQDSLRCFVSLWAGQIFRTSLKIVMKKRSQTLMMQQWRLSASYEFSSAFLSLILIWISTLYGSFPDGLAGGLRGKFYLTNTFIKGTSFGSSTHISSESYSG